MEVKDFLLFLQKAIKKEQEERIREQWVALLPYMNMKVLKYMPYQEYKEKATGKNIDVRPVDEIVKEIEDAHKRANMEV